MSYQLCIKKGNGREDEGREQRDSLRHLRSLKTSKHSWYDRPFENLTTQASKCCSDIDLALELIQQHKIKKKHCQGLARATNPAKNNSQKIPNLCVCVCVCVCVGEKLSVSTSFSSGISVLHVIFIDLRLSGFMPTVTC